MAAERRDMRPSQGATDATGRPNVERLILELRGADATEALGEALGTLAEAGDVILMASSARFVLTFQTWCTRQPDVAARALDRQLRALARRWEADAS